MFIVSKNTGNLLLPFEGRVRQLWPEAKQLVNGNGTLAILPHTPQTHIRLRAAGIEAPAPILSQYDWEGETPFATQKATAELLTGNQRAYVLNDMGCVDADTEYLGENGWHRIADYTGGKVAQYNPKEESIELVEPEKFVRLPCEEMIRFKTNRGVDQLLSPEHRVLLANGRVLSAEEVEAIYLQGRQTIETRALRFRTTFNVPKSLGIGLTNAEIRVQVAVNADGYTATPSTNRVHINIRKERKIQRLRQLLVSAGIDFKEYAKSGKYEGYITFTFVAPWTKGFDKRWWRANQQQLHTVANELVHWDGARRKSFGQEFFSTKKADVDFAQYAYAASGLRAIVRLDARAHSDKSDCYRVYAAYNKDTAGLLGQASDGSRIANVWREPSSDGFKYCFMVPSTFLLLRRNGCIFATGNTGKTRAALWAWRYLNRTGAARKLLVVAPLSTLSFVWAGEVARILPRVQATVLYGTRQQRRDLLKDSNADIFIINHDGLRTIEAELRGRADIDCLIIDELAVYRNASQRSKLMRGFVQRFSWAWGLTGRPMPNAPTDVWQQCRILTPGSVPKYFRHARTMLMQQVSQFKWVPKPDAVETAFSWMRPSIRFTLDDVMELPEAIYRTIDCAFSSQQVKIYRKLANELTVMVENKQITVANAGVAVNKLLQVGAGAVYTENPQYVTLDSSTRQSVLLELIREASEKVIVFAPWRHLLFELSTLFSKKDKHNDPIEHAVVHGGITHREKIFNDFQMTDKYKILLAHPGTVHHGLTLTAATTIIWYSPVMSLEVYEQANARIRRVGQKRKQQFIHLQGSGTERQMYALLRRKQHLQDSFLQLVKDTTDEKR